MSINSKFFDGPYGGGMQFANFLQVYFEKNGVKVVNTLKDDDIDIILHVSPFPHLAKASSYSYLRARAYKLTHPRCRIIHRVNECDERKGTTHINAWLLRAAKTADVVVFISTWLKDLFLSHGLSPHKETVVILNGANTDTFYPAVHSEDRSRKPLSIVTHHWSGHVMKGHDVYKKLDDLLAHEKFSRLFTFTYIGNLPANIQYKHTQLLPAASGKALANELRKGDIYLTASQCEPAGMHHVEGALCGLPLLYRNSGALPEYCNGFGVMFSGENFQEKLLEIRDVYNELKRRMSTYSHTADHMAQEYLALCQRVHEMSMSVRPDKLTWYHVVRARALIIFAVSQTTYLKVRQKYFKSL